MIPPTRGWVAQWQSVQHVWGSPGFDPRSGLFFLFPQGPDKSCGESTTIVALTGVVRRAVLLKDG